MGELHPPVSAKSGAPSRFSDRFRPFAALTLIALILLAYALFADPSAIWLSIRLHLTHWQAFVAEHLLLSALIYFLIYLVCTACCLPIATVLSLTAGALFGRWIGLLVAVTSASCGATLAFLASRYLLRDWVRATFGRRLDMIERGVARDGAYYLFSLRMMPVFPYFVLNLGMGITSLPARTFLIVSFLGMIPGGFVFVNIGTEAARIESVRGLISIPLLTALTLLGFFPLLARWLVRRVLRRRAASRRMPNSVS